MPTQTSPQPERDTRSWPRRHKIITGLGVLVVVGILISITTGGGGSPTSSSSTPTARSSSSSAPASSAPASSAPASHASNPAPQHTVAYTVTGSTADVTYGPIGSSDAGTSPMHKVVSLDSTDAIGYSLSAQLQGGGSVACAITIDGKVISTAHASGGYNIAICEAVRDPISGDYTDANKG